MNDLDLEHRRQQVGTSPAVWKAQDLRYALHRAPATGQPREANDDAQRSGPPLGTVMRVMIAIALVGSLAGLIQTHAPGFWARNVLVRWPMVMIMATFGLRSTL